MIQGPWPQEVLQRHVPPTVAAGFDSPEQEEDGKAENVPVPSACFAVLPLQVSGAGRLVPPGSPTEEMISRSGECVLSAAKPDDEQSRVEPDQADLSLDVSPPPSEEQEAPQTQWALLSIERAIQAYLREHREAGHLPKTLEWHQRAQGLFQQDLVGEQHLFFGEEAKHAG